MRPRKARWERCSCVEIVPDYLMRQAARCFHKQASCNTNAGAASIGQPEMKLEMERRGQADADHNCR